MDLKGAFTGTTSSLVKRFSILSMLMHLQTFVNFDVTCEQGLSNDYFCLCLKCLFTFYNCECERDIAEKVVLGKGTRSLQYYWSMNSMYPERI